jgi:hypothetical protein
MAMVFARATLPGWVGILALAAFFAPAAMATTVLLVALGIACLPVFFTAGVLKRTYRDAAAVDAGQSQALVVAETPAIDAEFTVEPPEQPITTGNERARSRIRGTSNPKDSSHHAP